jgi:hypothetical protein
MSSDENESRNGTTVGEKRRQGALQLGTRKKPYATTVNGYNTLTEISGSRATDPLVHYGRHFGRTVHALCTVSVLLNNGLIRMRELAEKPDDGLTHE